MTAEEITLKWQNSVKWSVWDVFKSHKNVPAILDMVSTLNALLNDSSLSIARIADGELGLMTGVKIPNSGRQHHSKSLANSLKTVMQCDNERCRVALPKWFMYKVTPVMNPDASRFARDFATEVKKGHYFNYFKPGYTYFDACFSVPRAHFEKAGDAFFQAYYSLARRLFLDRDVILVTGDPRHAFLDHKLIHGTAKTITQLQVPQIDAWAYHDAIKKTLLDMNPQGSRDVVLCCGATATVLAYELSDKMRCLDIGHMPIDYNLAMHGKELGWFWH